MLMKAIEIETSAGIYKHYDIVSYIFQIQLDYLTEFFIQFHTKNQKKMKHLMVFSLNISYHQF